MTDSTTGAEIVARVSLTVRAAREPCLAATTPRTTSVPGGPFIRAVAASSEIPASERPLTVMMTSPARSFARAAGEESNTRAIASPRRLGPTLTPMPAKLGGRLKLWNSLGVR